MTATATELQLSRRATHGRRMELLYKVVGTDSEATAITTVLAVAPTSYTFVVDAVNVVLPRQRPEIEPLIVDTGASTGVWLARVLYEATARGSGPAPQSGDSSFSFDTTGGTQRVTQALSTVASYVQSGTATNYKGAIGWDGQQVQGVDLTIPVYRFGETHYKTNATINQAYKLTVQGLTGKTNNATFRGFAAGEVLFLGASGARRGTGSDDLWEITYQFAVSLTRSGFAVGDITVTTKAGWDYLWVAYKEDVDATTGVRRQIPAQVNIERVYEQGNFSGLGIS